MSTSEFVLPDVESIIEEPALLLDWGPDTVLVMLTIIINND
ncbi:MAG: hypothetical protein ABI238_00455 [Terrimesophilobacter sp.]